MKTDEILSKMKSDGGAELTNRLIDTDPNFERPEWMESGTLDGVPVAVYYRTTPEDQAEVVENGGDWGAVDWSSRVDRIEVDLVQCDRDDTPGEAIAAVRGRYGI